MENSVKDYPFNNYRSGITDPQHFFGRSQLLDAMIKSPFQVRILLGSRRLGKTSTLNTVKARLLNPQVDCSYRAFPVLFDMQQEQPFSLDNLRYLMIMRLKDAIADHQKQMGRGLRSGRGRFLRQISEGGINLFGVSLKVKNPTADRQIVHEDFRQEFLATLKPLKKMGFEGVCYLIDGAEFAVRQEWANDAWSYLRALKDTDTALKPFLGFLFSGYRDLKDYQQKVGSPLLNIAEVSWLSALSESEAKALITWRSHQTHAALDQEKIDLILSWAGCHPYLTQQMLNAVLNNPQLLDSPHSLQTLRLQLIRQHDREFSSWWHEDQRSYGFSELEQKVYYTLLKQGLGSINSIAQQADLSFGQVADALEVLAGTGVILKQDEEHYRVGADLFREWLTQETESV